MNDRVYLFIMNNDTVLLQTENGSSVVPSTDRKTVNDISTELKFSAGYYNGIECFAVGGEHGIFSGESSYDFHKIRAIHESIPEELFRLILRGSHLLYWAKNNMFCGRCGQPMTNDDKETARRCTSCGSLVFPRISPAVIVAVTDGDKILLAQGNRPGFNFYSVLAGFVEPGESLEECAAREIKEEVGIRVKNIKYFGSQEWPFPDSLMIAFTAEYAGGELKIDPVEIVKAEWFTRDNMPVIPGKLSIARKLIDWFTETRSNGKNAL